MASPSTVPYPRTELLMPRVSQGLFWLVGIFFVLWACFAPQFRSSEGVFNGTVCLPFAAGIASMLMGCMVTGSARWSGFWLAVALVGQAVALQMIEAGPQIRYQHYKSLGRLFSETHPSLLVFLSLQTVLVLCGLKSRWHEIRVWVSRTFNAWQLFGIALVFILTSATVSRDLTAYFSEVTLAAFIQALNLATVMLMVWSIPPETLVGVETILKKVFGHRSVENRDFSIQNQQSRVKISLDAFVLIAALWVGITAGALSLFVYESHPHIEDEVIYLFHARYLAEGLLTVPAPPVPEAFSFYMIPDKAENWFSIFPPGWPLMLAVGVLIGAPWLVNPLLGSLNVLLCYFILMEIYSVRTARIAVSLLCLSPWFIFMSMNFMAHTFTLTCSLAAWLALILARSSKKIYWGLLGGGALGMVSLIRPLDGLVAGGVLGVWAIIRRLKLYSVLAFVLGAVLVGALVFPYNQQITGNPIVFPLMDYYEKYFGPGTNSLGFGPGRGLNWPIDAFPGHSPIEAVINANLNLCLINIELFGWITGSLFIVALLLFSGTAKNGDYFMLAVLVAVSGAFSFYWFSGGPDFGARYWYLTLVPLVALTARGIQFLESTFQSFVFGASHQSTRVTAAVLSLSLLALINFFPWRVLDKYYHYLGMRPDIRYLAKAHGFGKSIVLIRGNVHPDYQSAWIFNPLDPHADAPIYVWDRNPQVRSQVLQSYADRPIWIVNGPTITGAGFQVVTGPLAPGFFDARGS